MKDFNDLVFKAHPNGSVGFGKQARIDFDNGFGVSVVTGEQAYTDIEHPYEIAIMKDGNITYDTNITEDVLGYNDSRMVSDIMMKCQNL